jgi:hypothetical protein
MQRRNSETARKTLYNQLSAYCVSKVCSVGVKSHDFFNHNRVTHSKKMD